MTIRTNKRRTHLLLLGLASLVATFFILLAGQSPGRISAAGDLELSLELFASGFSAPTDIAFDPDQDRAFVVEKQGYIQRVVSGGPAANPFLDITDRVLDLDAQQGLLGLAFHPDYASNRYLYVNYTDLSGNTIISRFTANAQNTVADPDSEFEILSVEQPYLDNNGGDLVFGPDGYLYIPLGDGGWVNDPASRAQDPQTLLGKILRIDVDSGSPYAIPADNPYVDDPGVLDEIWAFGMRNPWRASFDRDTGELYVADVGQFYWEEINVQSPGAGGLNHGWSCFEGQHENPDTNVPDCGPPEEYALPVAEYDHTAGDCAVTGGYVYRGSQQPGLLGRYFLSDYCSGHFWDLYQDGGGDWILTRHDNLVDFGYVTFGEDGAGELYVGNIGNGNIYHLVGESTITPTPTATATATVTATATATATATPTMTPTPTATPEQPSVRQLLPVIISTEGSDG